LGIETLLLPVKGVVLLRGYNYADAVISSGAPNVNTGYEFPEV